mgnify:CR=1 FL=1
MTDSNPSTKDPAAPSQRRDALIGAAVLAVVGLLFALSLHADRAATVPGSALQVVDTVVPRDDRGPLPILDQPCDGSKIRGRHDLAEPLFRDAVYVLCRHGRHGAIGLRIDLPTEAPASAVYTLPGTLFVGGPLATTRAVLLYRDPEGGLRWTTSHRRARTLARNTTLRALVGLGPEPDAIPKVLAGHAAWGPGQLEAELGAGAWILLDEGG